jgi:hypothetical protein
MNRFKYLTLYLLSLAVVPVLQAREFVGLNNGGGQGNGGGQRTTQTSSYRNSCIESRAETDLNINNVRARLRAGGDVWWNGNIARYVVPNVDPASGEPEVSSIYAGAIWLGAYDDGGNLILAAQTYRSGGNDYWTGPLDTTTGTTEKAICENWDRHFRVLGADIDALRADFLAPDANGQSDFTVDSRPSRALLGWPGRGNPHFSAIYGFDLPDQDLAPFIEAPGREDGIYDPYDGDHPVIEVAGCGNNYFAPVYADEMIWWVFNDRGNLHSQSNGLPMSMEVQALAFAYRTTDAINNMTFYRYKLLNRNSLRLRDTYFSLWTDPDLGCFNDDQIGCDTLTGMGYVYNADNNDDATCGAQGLGYGTTIPALGVDYFRGPLDSAGNQIGLSAFQYHVNQAGPTGDPNSALGYYRLMSGFWPDGTAVSYGGNGYNTNITAQTPYVFPSFPNDQSPGAWSMCNGGTTGAGDFRFLHTSGPFVLLPGATNELISGVVWVPEIPDYPCPSLRELVTADVLAQNLFDDCFKITDGPDAPYADVIEMENELILNLSYVPSQNNYQLGYREEPARLRGLPDSAYVFEGYKIYQVKDPNASVTDLDDPAKSRLLFQTDVRNGVNKITNWTVFPDEDIRAFIPQIMVDGEDKGIKHTFQITEDKFASGDPKLINHKPYYFCVVAYGYNEYEPYNSATNEGQALPYLQGRRNFRIYTGIPRNNSPEYYGAVINAKYGDRPEITRIDGRGNGGGLFLDFADRASAEQEIFNSNRIGKVTYAEGKGPIDVKVVDPLRVAPGVFQLYIGDKNYGWNRDSVAGQPVFTPVPPASVAANYVMTDSLFWVLKKKDDASKIWFSYQPLTTNYEQFIPEIGLSFNIEQIATPGSGGVSGFIGASREYTDSATAIRWYKGVLDESTGKFNILKTGNAQVDQALDPNEDYSDAVGGWYPVLLADCKYRADEFHFSMNQIQDPNNTGNSFCDVWRPSNLNRVLSRQRNVNVVLTPDQSKWSRCIVVESGNHYYSTGLGFGTLPSGKKQLEWKNNQASIGKDGLPDNTGNGMSWFPGYAYDVETGERLNVLFGENSFLNGNFFDPVLYEKAARGNDMIYNPTDLAQIGFDFGNEVSYLSSVLGGQHVLYVANTPYDECQSLIDVYNLPPNPLLTPPYRILKDNYLIWGSIGYMELGTTMDGAKENIPPSEVTFKLRVATPYNVFNATNENTTYPLYEFSLDSYTPTKQDQTAAESALDLINIVPNPYYAYSDYEVTEVDNVIKVTNLPPRCDVRIYSIDGRFIRQYNVSQDYNSTTRSGIARIGAFGSGDVENQITTSLNWDLKNTAGVPVSSGVYLVHVVVPEVGERVLKSFIINRAFDAQKL